MTVTSPLSYTLTSSPTCIMVNSPHVSLYPLCTTHPPLITSANLYAGFISFLLNTLIILCEMRLTTMPLYSGTSSTSTSYMDLTSSYLNVPNYCAGTYESSVSDLIVLWTFLTIRHSQLLLNTTSCTSKPVLLCIFATPFSI